MESKFRLMMDKTYEYPNFIAGSMEGSMYILFRHTQIMLGPYNEIRIKHNVVLQLIDDTGYKNVDIYGREIDLDSMYGYNFESNPLAEYIVRTTVEAVTEAKSTEDIKQLLLAGSSWKITPKGVGIIKSTASIKISVIKLWGEEYTHISVPKQEGLWSNRDNKWALDFVTHKIEVRRYMDDMMDRNPQDTKGYTPSSRLDYLLLHSNNRVYVIGSDFRQLGSLDDSTWIKRITRRKWAISKEKYDTVEVRTDIEKSAELIQNKGTVSINGVRIELQGISYNIIDANGERVLKELGSTDIMEIITLEDINDRVFRRDGEEVYEITKSTKVSDSMDKLRSSMKVESVNDIVYGGIDYILTSIAPYKALSSVSPGRIMLHGVKREEVENTIY